MGQKIKQLLFERENNRLYTALYVDECTKNV